MQKERNKKEKYTKKWEDLQIRDDFMFSKVMRDKATCIAVLEKLLKLEISDIDYLDEQKVIDVDYDARSVRLDVYVEEGRRVFNLEMQAGIKTDLPYRSRYYQGMIDLNAIEKGEAYRDLKESYVVFICTFDPFGHGKAQYVFENLCVGDAGIRLGDGTKKVFFCSNNYGEAEDTDIREFLRYVDGEKSENEFVRMIDDKVEKVKSKKEWRREYMTLLMRYNEERAEGREEGLREGRREGRQEGLREGLIAGKIQSVLDCLGELGDVPTLLEERISNESDPEKLRRWVKLAARAESISDFEEKAGL